MNDTKRNCTQRSVRYLCQITTRIVFCALVLALAVAIVGALAIPLVLSVMYSWYWMFLYILYVLVLFSAFSAIVEAGSEYGKNGGKHEDN